MVAKNLLKEWKDSDLYLTRFRILTANTIFLLLFIQEAIKQQGFLESLLAGFKDANKTKLAVKTRAIETLPLILQHCSTSAQVDEVCTQVGRYVAEAFPTSSKDLTQGTAAYLDYMAQLDQV